MLSFARGRDSAVDDTEQPYVEAGVVEEHATILPSEESDHEDITPVAAVPTPVSATDKGSLIKMESFRSLYSQMPIDQAELVPAGDTGLVWHALILPDNYQDPKHVSDRGELRPRRPMPQARATEFFLSLVRTKDGRWIFGGVLNGWPALTQLEVRSITYKPRGRGMGGVRRYYHAKAGVGGASLGFVPHTNPELAELHASVLAKASVRVTLRAPPWSSLGYSADAPGFVFWYDRSSGGTPKVHHGMHAVRAGEAQAGHVMERVHLFGHRYAKVRESAMDRITYHSAVLVEWSGGREASVVELAWRFGLGGYGGKSNFVEDRDAPRPQLYDAMPACMKAPWRQELSEIRVLDVPCRTRADFEAFLRKYTGRTQRFVDPAITKSAPVRLSLRTPAHLLRYLVNYVRANPAYTMDSRNCQTFAADLFRFLSGTEVEPFSPLMRARYVVRARDFLYEPPPVEG